MTYRLLRNGSGMEWVLKEPAAGQVASRRVFTKWPPVLLFDAQYTSREEAVSEAQKHVDADPSVMLFVIDAQGEVQETVCDNSYWKEQERKRDFKARVLGGIVVAVLSGLLFYGQWAIFYQSHELWPFAVAHIVIMTIYIFQAISNTEIEAGFVAFIFMVLLLLLIPAVMRIQDNRHKL